MSDAVGSSILFYIILIFLGLFIVFIAFIMQYATAYRASNYVVTMLERTEGQVVIGDSKSTAGDGTIYGALKERLYNNGVQIKCSNNNNGAVFKVTTKLQFDLPLIEVHLPIYINNETKTIYGVSCEDTKYPNNNTTGGIYGDINLWI